jgi:glycerol-3-phosphate dehydrogenase
MLYDVAIIGGGVTGCAIARELARFRLRAVLLDKECEVGFGTSKSNSGIIHAGHHSPANTLKGQLVVEGNRAFPLLAKELAFGYRQVGEVVVARDEAEVAALEALAAQGRAKGVEGLQMWSRERLQMEEPNLSPTLVAGLYAPTAGVINPYEFCFNLIENARHNGLELLVESPVRSIQQRDGYFSLATPRHLIHARFVINAAGLYAARVAAMLGLADFTIQPRKGEEYMLDKRMRGVVQRIIFPVPTANSKGTLVIPTFDGTIMVGPTAEDVDSLDDLATSTAGARAVFDRVRRIVPSIHPGDTIAAFAGLRAVSDTNDFIIAPSSIKGFIHAAGIQSPGLTAAPAIGRLVRDILEAEGLALVPKDDFDPVVAPIPRFSALSTADKVAHIGQDPRFARIACRCEEVTEREIHDAIDRGARTLDGLKFRVRAGMGRCQGGFCTWRCMEMLAERLAIPLTEVTKRGAGSHVVIDRLEPPASEEAAR